ncbi:CocE/NonD family hydrolase [Aquihabitans sp. G128]|uniref:CocE/NonD family hydrolase n=1 Tax=Aquihabitans sp. G128 TaxID=2849779 RepID=UPI001C23399B|nr:CocE/NonD family hydrolase [Aquihabitans sp. G128]QXC61138.1 CocE/NonD family hydrolase [Aquihabitans sp. G128]
MGKQRARIVAVVLAAGLLAGGCTSSDPSGSDGAAKPTATTGPGSGAKATGRFATDLDVDVDADTKTAKATFEVDPGTEEVTVTGLEPKARASLVKDGKRLVVLKADTYGQAHFAYLPAKLAEFQTGAGGKLPFAEGYLVEAGKGYTVRAEDTDPVQVSKPFTVLGRDDHPDGAFFDEQAGKLVPKGDETDLFGYVTMRDGVELSVNVRLPGPASKGPYPTVVEYSGYGPANPDATEPGSMIAGLLGYATIGVNMRGTGCSGGAFDVFNTAQQVDGYDVIEAIARQPWVKGHKVGMVGLSYSGITQLYVAATRPPSLAAVTALSVIKDPWLQQWPGGVYNGGFTKSWLDERDKESSATGTSWVAKRIEGGDATCKAHQRLREQNIDFQAFGESLVHRPALTDGRDLSKLVSKIDVPVYLTGAWQDEQTGPQFADMLGNFTHAPVKRFTMFNGRHPDGYTPLVLTRWYEFLELFVDQEVPRIAPGLRAAAPSVFEDEFGVAGLNFEPDRFTKFADDQYDEALQAYEAEPDVRVLFESGAGGKVPGSPQATFETTYASWPPKGTEARSFYLGDDGALGAKAPADEAADTFANDPASASKTFFGKSGYSLLDPTWDFDWTRFGTGKALSYVTKPFTDDTVLGGPGYAELYARVPDGDADVQVSINVIRPDDTEWHVTTGLLRLSDRKTDSRSKGLYVDRTYSEADSRKMPAGEFVPVKVAFPSFAQAFRKGDRLRVVISSPGRDFGAWSFADIGDPGTARDIGRGGGQASRLVLGVLPGIDEVPPLDAPCPSLRGQACRPYQPSTNEPAG